LCRYPSSPFNAHFFIIVPGEDTAIVEHYGIDSYQCADEAILTLGIVVVEALVDMAHS
jgi:hypothetical protein